MTSTCNSATSSAIPTLSATLLAEIDRIVSLALKEDLADIGDLTTSAIVPPTVTATAAFVVKQQAVIAGLPVVERVFSQIDPAVKFEACVAEGSKITTFPAVCARLTGSARSILIGERTALNLFQRISGIATATQAYSEITGKYGIKVLDTRKTTPGLRALEKYAVTAGGGTNHRIGLYDRILIKDNHIRVAGGITPAIDLARKHNPGMPVEVEVTNMEELDQALAAKAETIMLDNMTPDQVQLATEKIAKRSFVEVSGGINLQNIWPYLLPGVDAISIGALTHSVESIDISLEVEL